MKLFTITYAYGQQCTFPEYRNRATDKLHRFEYNPVLDIVANHLGDVRADEFVGIFSHKFELKTGHSRSGVTHWLGRHELEPLNGHTFDLINFSPNMGNPINRHQCFMDWSAYGHGEVLRDLVKACCAHTGMEYHNNPQHVVYANFFAARKSVYLHYVDAVVKPCLALLEGPLWHLANQCSRYKGLPPEELKRLTGLDYYSYVPFVMERLTMQYVVNHNIKILSL